jgi:hypothetical protein
MTDFWNMELCSVVEVDRRFSDKISEHRKCLWQMPNRAAKQLKFRSYRSQALHQLGQHETAVRI